MTMYQSLPSANVSLSAFVCIRNLEPEEVRVTNCSLSTQKQITA